MKELEARNFIKSYGKYIIMLAVFILVSYVLLYLTYENIKQKMVEDLNVRQMIHAKQAAKGIESFFNHHLNMLIYLSKPDSIIALDDRGKALMRLFYSNNSAEINGITRVDAKGRIQYTYPYDPKAINADISSQEHVQEIMRTHKPVVSDVFTAVQGFRCVAFHVPVFQGKNYQGTIAVLIPFDHISKKYLEDIKIGESGYAWMISRKGVELYCPVPGHVGNSVFDNCRDFPDILAMAERMIRGEQGVTTYQFDRIGGDVVSKTNKQAVFMPIRIANNFWSIVIATPEDEVIGAMQGFRNRLILIAVLFVIGMGFFIYMVFRTRVLIEEIEQRRKTEEAIRESEERYRAIFENTGTATVILEEDTTISLANTEFVNLTGYTREEIEGKKSWTEFVVKEDLERMLEQHRLRRVEPGTAQKNYDFRIVDRDGQIKDIHHRGDLIPGTKKSVASLLDITERKRAEEALRDSEERYRNIFENAIEGIYQSTPEGVFINVNPAMAKMCGYESPVEMVQSITDISTQYYVDSQDRERFKRLLDEHGRIDNIEYRIRRKDGGIIWVSVSARVVCNDHGELLYYEGTVADITERKRLEERLHRAEKMEALGTLAGGVAHDLNNVLGVLVGYSELMLEKIPEGNPLRRHASNILQSSERGAAIIQDLLTLARRGVTVSDVTNLNNVISDYFKTPEFEKLKAFHPGVNFNTHLQKDLLNIKGSSIHLGKTVMNLVSNASEAIPNGGQVTIKTENRYLDKPIQGYDDVQKGDYVVLTVSDNGRGISNEDIGKIFEPFYTKKVMGRSGTGLGLAVVWGTVKDHHGYIDVHSEEGKGSTFALYFPVTREELTRDREKLSPEEYIGKGESILVVDDVKEQREVATSMLVRLGYRVDSASSGEEAIKYLKTNKADLVVLDMIMDPGIDGLETYKRILEIKPGQKAIIVSGFSETDRVKEAQELGAAAYIRKPYVLEKIGLAIRRELDRK